MVSRLIGPQAISANALAQEIGVAQESLSRWLRQSHNVEGMAPVSNSKKPSLLVLKKKVQEIWADQDARTDPR